MTTRSRAPDTTTGGVQATARVTATATDGTTDLSVLHGDGPIDPRRLRSHRNQARVCLVNAMSAPHNGDRLRIEVTVEPGADLHITSATATVALPGPAPGYATYDITLRVGEDARLHWAPEPVISAADSDLRQTIRVDLAPTARLVLSEQQILGRAHEPPGRLTTHLIVHHGGRTLLNQHTTYGPGTPTWNSPAIVDDYRAIAQLLIIDPDLDNHPPHTQILHDTTPTTHAMITPLTGPARLLTALAPDTRALQHILTTAQHHLGTGTT